MSYQPQNYGTMSSHPSDVQFGGGGSSAEFNSLCDNIVTNIYTINSSWKVLENGFKNLGTNRDNQGLRDKMLVVLNTSISFLLEHLF